MVNCVKIIIIFRHVLARYVGVCANGVSAQVTEYVGYLPGQESMQSVWMPPIYCGRPPRHVSIIRQLTASSARELPRWPGV